MFQNVWRKSDMKNLSYMLKRSPVLKLAVNFYSSRKWIDQKKNLFIYVNLDTFFSNDESHCLPIPMITFSFWFIILTFLYTACYMREYVFSLTRLFQHEEKIIRVSKNSHFWYFTQWHEKLNLEMKTFRFHKIYRRENSKNILQ